MLKIRDMNVGQTVTAPLLVKSSEIRRTKSDKPYLFVVLTDGSEDLPGQDWDFGDNPPPAMNSVLEVKGQISEYMGRKQIKLLSIKHTDIGVENFAPTGNIDASYYNAKARELIEGISNEHLQDIVRRVFNDNKEAIRTLPAAAGMHHAYVSGLLQHTVDVALKAKALAQLTKYANVDLVVAGALLHDMGKFWTYFLNGAVIDMTDEGQMIEHIMLGAIRLENYRNTLNSGAIDLLQHIISSHHGRLEYGSPTTPRFIEALIVHYADAVDAKCQMAIEAIDKTPENATWTQKVWALDNKTVRMPSKIEEALN